nr:interleukin-7 receptor subunit alpha isoform X1 [Pogona vitticeps]
MMRSTLCACFWIIILLPAVPADSGSGASVDYGICDDGEIDTSFECFTQIIAPLKIYLICNATKAEVYPKDANITFTVKSQCRMKTWRVSNCSMSATDIISSVDVCLIMMLMKQQCRDCQRIMVKDIVKPEPPFGLRITHQEKANEYCVEFSTPYVEGSFLHNKLLYELAYRQENTSNWITRESEYIPINLMGKEFQPGMTYEMKVRSKPKGPYYKGSWGEWSTSQYWKTSAEINDYTMIMTTTSIVVFLLLFVLIVLVLVFWKNRIKPILWPTIPNHEKTLDKFCKKLRKNWDASFFNPESLGYVHIHKVDSIQAKSEVDHLQPSSLLLDAHVPQTLSNGLEQKNNLPHINQGWLKLALLYEGMRPAELLTKHLGICKHVRGDDTFIGANVQDKRADSSSDSQCSGTDDVSSCSTSSVDATTLYELQADPCHQSHASSETRVQNIEEAYVTMASFSEVRGKS